MASMSGIIDIRVYPMVTKGTCAIYISAKTMLDLLTCAAARGTSMKPGSEMAALAASREAMRRYDGLEVWNEDVV